MLPGTTRDLLVPALERSSRKTAGHDFAVCYNPEYLRAYAALSDFQSTHFVTIGCSDPNDPAVQRLVVLYSGLGDTACSVLSYEEAEFQKYVHNCFNAVKISFFNEMRMAAKELAIDPEAGFQITARTAQASWDPQYGITDRGAYAGACLPKDMNAWLAFAEQRTLPLSITHAAYAVNGTMGGE
jgi:UDPglucose 6-dehydrogenase